MMTDELFMCSMVCHGGHQLGDGLCDIFAASARHQELAASQETEGLAYGYILPRLLVRVGMFIVAFLALPTN